MPLGNVHVDINVNVLNPSYTARSAAKPKTILLLLLLLLLLSFHCLCSLRKYYLRLSALDVLVVNVVCVSMANVYTGFIATHTHP